MARYAIIENEIIVNVIVADEKFIKKFYTEAIECPDEIGVGDGYNGEKFIAKPMSDETLAE